MVRELRKAQPLPVHAKTKPCRGAEREGRLGGASGNFKDKNCANICQNEIHNGNYCAGHRLDDVTCDCFMFGLEVMVAAFFSTSISTTFYEFPN